jgi:hypothetical protein
VKSERWTKETDLEIEAIERNNIWELIELPAGGKKIGVKSIYKTKLNKNGEEWINTALGWYKKDTLVNIKVDYAKVFALVALLNIIQILISLAT